MNQRVNKICHFFCLLVIMEHGAWIHFFKYNDLWKGSDIEKVKEHILVHI
jgi:hypothetical protein